MAWIMKNSATMQVDRRDEPYLDDAMRAELESSVLSRYPTRQAALLPVLHAVQHRHGYVSHQAMEEVADLLELTPAEVFDAATFYEEFFFEPHGKYVIWVCQSISCELMGHDRLLDRLTAKLGIEPGQTTEDGRFTLMTVECLGSCGTAPCALLNEELHENLTAENFDKLIDSLP
jgi:NADH-quinone oxidoreductase subunit E